MLIIGPFALRNGRRLRAHQSPEGCLVQPVNVHSDRSCVPTLSSTSYVHASIVSGSHGIANML